MNIRPFNFTHDYDVVADIWNAAYPDQRSTAEEIRKNDETRPDNIIMRRFIAEAQIPVGFGVFLNSQDTYDPQKFWLTLALRPEHHGEGLRKGTLQASAERTRALPAPPSFSPGRREDWERQTRFWLERGFEEKMRYFESRLDVASFDPGPYKGLEKRLAAERIEIKDLGELEHLPDYRRKIYDLHTTLDADVPMIGAYTPPSV